MRIQINWQDSGLAPWSARRAECRGDLRARVEVHEEATGPKRLTLRLGWSNVKRLVFGGNLLTQPVSQ